jgi:hypothetical protein
VRFVSDAILNLRGFLLTFEVQDTVSVGRRRASMRRLLQDEEFDNDAVDEDSGLVDDPTEVDSFFDGSAEGDDIEIELGKDENMTMPVS